MARTNTNVCSTRGKQIENLIVREEDFLPLLHKPHERIREKQIKEFLLHKLHDEGTVFDVRFKFKWDNMWCHQWWDNTGRLTANNTPSEFVYVYAHRCVLETHAPELARICLLLSASDDNDENISTVNITDVKPDIFRYMIYYLYGVSVPQTELRKHAKDFIEVANKYSIVTLKAQAEASYMESTEIAKDNAIDNLLYADKMGCALLKEAVMNFFPSAEDVESLDLLTLTGSLRKEVIAAFHGFGPYIIKDYCKEKTLEDILSEPRLKYYLTETLLHKLICDQETADVCFKFNSEYVCSDREGDWDWDTPLQNNINSEGDLVDRGGSEGEGEQKKSKASEFVCVEFVCVYAHRCVLETYAPELARSCLSASDDNDENISTVNITDVKPDIFRYMIYYLYGVSVPQTELRKHAKDFIEVANKYSIVTLKAQAEASYMESTEIAKDNAIDNLLYADKMSCALLKEAAIKVLEKKEANENLGEKKTNEGGKAAKHKSEEQEQDSNAKEAEAEDETKTKKPKKNKTDSKKTTKNKDDDALVAGKSWNAWFAKLKNDNEEEDSEGEDEDDVCMYVDSDDEGDDSEDEWKCCGNGSDRLVDSDNVVDVNVNDDDEEEDSEGEDEDDVCMYVDSDDEGDDSEDEWKCCGNGNGSDRLVDSDSTDDVNDDNGDESENQNGLNLNLNICFSIRADR